MGSPKEPGGKRWGKRRSKSRAQLRDQMVKGLGAFKVRRPKLILQACIKHCNPQTVPELADTKRQGFLEPWPSYGAPKGLQEDSCRPTLRTAPRRASLPIPTATPPEVRGQVPWRLGYDG